LEAFFRLSESKPQPATLTALRKAVREDNPVTLTKLALLALNRAEDSDSETLTKALKHPDPQVRRLAVMGLKADKTDDPSPMVRYESLKLAGTCDKAVEAFQDTSGHVALLAVDKLGELGCSPEPLQKLASGSDNWRLGSRALVSLAKVNPQQAQKHLPRYAAHEIWQARVYAASAAKILKDEDVLARLVRDEHPNVVAAALVDPEDAVRVLSSSHYGLLVTAARRLEGWPDGASAVPNLLGALERVSAEERATSRDPRRQMLLRLREFGGAEIANRLQPLLSDFDPVIAKLAADIISEKVGVSVEPKTLRFETGPLPEQSYIAALSGARARIKMREAGTLTLELLPEEAPVTVAAFARLAEKGYYDGLTFHRVVPNFVIQGGSPGANEYVGTADYLRDELGLLSHVRGTVGISTRGRDTGDSQIFINLVDNYRLDHNYTVLARVVDGMEAVDAVLEGDVIESIEIFRR
jgi:cyclophilin family peptidyl-prolyl cis-trans isomerase/HEAT repeat protein